MPLATFTQIPLHPYEWQADRPVLRAPMAGGGEQRASLLSRALHRYILRFRVSSAGRAAMDAFFEARGWTLESFLWKDLKTYQRTAIDIGTGDGVEDTFVLPKTGVYGGDYPAAPFQLYVGASPVSGTVDTDARSFTYADPPAAAAVLTASYEFLRRVKLDGPYTWEERVFGIFWTELVLQEVVANA